MKCRPAELDVEDEADDKRIGWVGGQDSDRIKKRFSVRRIVFKGAAKTKKHREIDRNNFP